MSNVNKVMDAIHAVYREVSAVKQELVEVKESNKKLLNILSSMQADDFELELSGDSTNPIEVAAEPFKLRLRDLSNVDSIINLVERGILPKSDKHRLRYARLNDRLNPTTADTYARYAIEINNDKRVFHAFMMLRAFQYTNDTACSILMNKLGIKTMGRSSKANNIICAARYSGILTFKKGAFSFSPDFLTSLKDECSI